MWEGRPAARSAMQLAFSSRLTPNPARFKPSISHLRAFDHRG